jgi:predicted aspartyl protease
MPAYEGSLFTPPAPLARVTLRNPQNGATVSDVPMLLDSGADVTLVPQTLTGQLGIEIDLHEGYELIGFDGRTSLAHVVQLDLLFLKRVFKGRLLLIDQEWGLIGRDILNHLTLVFDGPRPIWSEGTSARN